MSRLLSLIFFVLSLGMLAGCGPIYNTEYAYVPPKSNMGKMCIAQCTQGKNMCEQMCQMQNDNCRMQARMEAREEYREYRHDRREEGKRIRRNVSDFDQGGRCDRPCGCEPQFNSCYSACGGQVLERQVCVAFCDKQ